MTIRPVESGEHDAFLGFVLFDVGYCVAYGCDLFGILIGNFEVEFLLKLHDELYSVERVSAKIFAEFCIGGYFGFVNSELVNDNSPYSICYFRHNSKDFLLIVFFSGCKVNHNFSIYEIFNCFLHSFFDFVQSRSSFLIYFLFFHYDYITLRFVNDFL